ncbi:MAG: flippase [Ignavibacteriales bacterium]
MRETTASIINNTKAMFAAQAVTWISSFFLMMFLPRYLGAESYGKLYFAMSLTIFGGLIIDLGISSLFVKEVARDRSKVNSFFMNGVSLRLIMWVIAMLGMLLYLFITGYSSELFTLIVILGFGKLLETISDLAHRIFQSFEQLRYRSIAVIIERVSLSVVGIVMLLAGYGIIVIAIVMTLSVLLNLLVCFLLLPKLVTLKIEITPSSWKGLLASSLPFLISTFFSFIYFRIDVIMLSAMTNDTVVGWYGAPYKLFDTMMFFPSILHIVVFPVFSRLWKQSHTEFFQTARQTLDATVIVAVAITFCLITLASPVVNLLFGLEEYSNSVILLQGLALIIPLIYINFIISTVDISADKQRALSIVSIIATFINIGLNFWLIPFFQNDYGNGAIGAMISTLITETCVMVMFIHLLPQGCFNKENLWVILKSLIAGIFSGVLVWYVESHLNIWYLSGLIGIIIYTAFLIAANVLTKKEFGLVLTIIPKRFSETTSRLFNL